VAHLKFRKAKASDINFIYDSFLKSMKNDSSLGRLCTAHVFFKEFPAIIDRILSDSETLVASADEDDETIIGYIIFEPNVVHYLFVKEAFRNLGIAKELIGQALAGKMEFTYTSRTHHIREIIKKYPGITFNPFKLYKKEHELLWQKELSTTQQPN